MTGTGAGGPTLCWLAPMLGATGAVPDVFEKLAPGLEARGYRTLAASSAPSGRRRVQEQVALLLGAGRRADATFVHVYGGRSFAIADLLSTPAARRSAPLIGYLSGGSIPDLARRRPAWVRRVLSRFDLLSAPSPYMARFATDLGLEAIVTPNPIDLGAFPYRRRTRLAPHLLWMRGFHAIYGPEVAVEVLARVREVHPAARLTMAGRDDGERAATEAAARARGVADAISFPGFLGPEARLQAIEGHDVFLHTNRLDNTPLSLIEAAAAGLPIVATDVGGVPDLFVDGEQVLLAPSGDAAALAAQVLALLDRPDGGTGLADAAHAVVQQMDLPVVLDRWEATLADLGVRRPGGAGRDGRP